MLYLFYFILFFSCFAHFATLRDYVLKFHAKPLRMLRKKYNIIYCVLPKI